MPAKHKNREINVKSAATADANVNMDQIDLIDRALGECNGLKDWIAGVLDEVKSIKQKNDGKTTEIKQPNKKPKIIENVEKNSKQKFQETQKNLREIVPQPILSNNNQLKDVCETAIKSLASKTPSPNIVPKKSTKQKPPPPVLPRKPISLRKPNNYYKNKNAKKAMPTKSNKMKEIVDTSSESGCSSSGSSGSNEIVGATEIDLHEIAEALPLLDVEALSLIGRSSQECLASYSKVNKRYLEVKRSMDSLMVDLNRVNLIVNRQRNIFHGGLLSPNNTIQVCHH